MTESLVLLAFVILLTLKLSAELVLDLSNLKTARNALAQPLPAHCQGVYTEERYQKALRYTLARQRFGILETLFDGAVLALVVGSGLLPWAWGFFTSWWGTGVWAQAASLGAVVILLGLPALPFDAYRQFRIEAEFGFNRSGPGLWLMDKFKGLLLGALLGLPLLALVLWFVSLSPLWWLWAFAAVFGFQLLMIVLYPRLILPLFNKLTPLPPGELQERLHALGDRTGFRARTIEVIDGSKRSSHSNAFFTGFGRFRRIVLFDTLIQQLSPRQLEGVLAHEIGHYRLGHIPRMLLVAALTQLTTFALAGWLAGAGWFAQAFGFAADSGAAPVLLLLALLGSLVGFWLSPLANHFSRRHEYQADAFARAALGGDPEPLIESLRTLSDKNLSNPVPHAWYSLFHYSHPTVPEREAALRRG